MATATPRNQTEDDQMQYRVKLSPAQVSAIECRMDGNEQVDGLVVEGGYLVFSDVEVTLDALCEASNSEDVTAQETTDSEVRGAAKRAARSLAAISGLVLKRAA